MDSITIPLGLAQAINQYLLSRPMREVEGLVNGLRQSASAPSEKPSKGKGKADDAS